MPPHLTALMKNFVPPAGMGDQCFDDHEPPAFGWGGVVIDASSRTDSDEDARDIDESPDLQLRTNEGPEEDSSEHPESVTASHIPDEHPIDPTDTIDCCSAGRSPKLCPLNIHKAGGRFNKKVLLTRGLSSLFCGGC